MSRLRKAKPGFTIIEVVLVLAIAGLIFLMVFVALPALNSSQRDTQRKNDVAILAAAVRDYMKYNRGKTPPDSGSEAAGDIFDADDERTGLGDWENPNSSHTLDKYIGADIPSGGVTTGYSITNLVNEPVTTTSLYLTISGNAHNYRYNISNDVMIIIGGACPDMSQQTKNYFQINITHTASNIAIFRMLENGYWYCKNV